MRDDRWVIPDLVGKRKKVRLVPVPGWVKDRPDLWSVAAKINEGKIFRAVGKNDKVSGASLSTTAVGRSCSTTRTRSASNTWGPTI
jgi:hypothetical protein